MILFDLVSEKPLGGVASAYQQERGTLQALQTSAATFAGLVHVFCNRLCWWDLELLIANFKGLFFFFCPFLSLR
jgi:DNA polymerase theta